MIGTAISAEGVVLQRVPLPNTSQSMCFGIPWTILRKLNAVVFLFHFEVCVVEDTSDCL